MHQIHKKKRARHQGWFRLFVLGWIIVFSASCTQAIKDRLFNKQVVEGASSCPSCTRFQKALQHLQAGRNETAREIFKELSREGGTSHVGPASEFYLGVIKLFDMEDLQGMEACKSYFEGYIERYPTEPYEANAVRIVRILKKYIEEAHTEEQQVKKLNRVVQEQAREIRTLKYQMRKLEEIHEETDRKRDILEWEEKK
jgi:outer membrane protein assembly factor BamD (BamD/ComL family)